MRWALIDFRQPFFRPMNRRIIIILVMLLWTVVEFFGGSMPWLLFFVALTAYVGWGFFLSGQPDEPLPEPGEAAEKPSSGDGA